MTKPKPDSETTGCSTQATPEDDVGPLQAVSPEELRRYVYDYWIGPPVQSPLTKEWFPTAEAFWAHLVASGVHFFRDRFGVVHLQVPPEVGEQTLPPQAKIEASAPERLLRVASSPSEPPANRETTSKQPRRRGRPPKPPYKADGSPNLTPRQERYAAAEADLIFARKESAKDLTAPRNGMWNAKVAKRIGGSKDFVRKLGKLAPYRGAVLKMVIDKLSSVLEKRLERHSEERLRRIEAYRKEHTTEYKLPDR
jgi:hypothetical protein